MSKYIFVCIFFLCCCRSDKDHTIIEPKNIITLNPNKTDSIKVSDIFSNITYLKLETPEGVYIGEPSKVLFHDDNIYILDNTRTLNLIVFRSDGTVKYEISSFGRGPGEFASPNDFDIIYDKNELIIYDSVNLKVIYYDLNNGSFKYEKNVRFMTKNIASNKNGLVFFNNNFPDGKHNYNITFTDNNIKPINRDISINDDMYGIHFILPTTFTKNADVIFLTIPFDNIIYEIKDDKVAPYIMLNFEHTALPKDFFTNHNNNQISYSERHKYSHNVSSFFENDDILYFNYWYNSGLCRYISDKKNVSSYHLCDSKIIRDLDYGSYLGWGLGLVDRKLVFYDQPYRLKKYIDNLKTIMTKQEWNSFMINNKSMFNFFETLTHNDNPYLIFAEIRQL
jgi:hypothetical protein